MTRQRPRSGISNSRGIMAGIYWVGARSGVARRFMVTFRDDPGGLGVPARTGSLYGSGPRFHSRRSRVERKIHLRHVDEEIRPVTVVDRIGHRDGRLDRRRRESRSESPLLGSSAEFVPGGERLTMSKPVTRHMRSGLLAHIRASFAAGCGCATTTPGRARRAAPARGRARSGGNPAPAA